MVLVVVSKNFRNITGVFVISAHRTVFALQSAGNIYFMNWKDVTHFNHASIAQNISHTFSFMLLSAWA